MGAFLNVLQTQDFCCPGQNLRLSIPESTGLSYGETLVAVQRERRPPGRLSLSSPSAYELLCEASEHHQIGVEPDSFQTSDAEFKGVVVLQPSELALYGAPTSVELLVKLGVPADARVVTGRCVCLGPDQSVFLAFERDHGVNPASVAVGVDAYGVVAFVHRGGLRCDASLPDFVDQWCGEQGVVGFSGGDFPRERQPSLGTDGEMKLVAVVGSGSACADGRSVPPCGVRVAVAIPERPVLVDTFHAVCVGGHVASVDCDVSPQARKRGLEGADHTVKTLRQNDAVLPQLGGEAVAGPEARAAAQGFLQALVVADEGVGACPGRDVVERLDQARSNEDTSAVTFPPCPGEGIQLGDELGDFGAVEQSFDFFDSSASRYFSSCHWSYRSFGHAPGRLRVAGALFLRRDSLTLVSDGTVRAGGGRGCNADQRFFVRCAGSDPRRSQASCVASTATISRLVVSTNECGRRDSNPQPCTGTAPKAAASTSSATPAFIGRDSSFRSAPKPDLGDGVRQPGPLLACPAEKDELAKRGGICFRLGKPNVWGYPQVALPTLALFARVFAIRKCWALYATKSVVLGSSYPFRERHIEYLRQFQQLREAWVAFSAFDSGHETAVHSGVQREALL